MKLHDESYFTLFKTEPIADSDRAIKIATSLAVAYPTDQHRVERITVKNTVEVFDGIII